MDYSASPVLPICGRDLGVSSRYYVTYLELLVKKDV